MMWSFCNLLHLQIQLMKKIILLIAIAGCLAFAKVNAQTVKGIRLSEIRADYIEISEFKPLLNDKIFIALE